MALVLRPTGNAAPPLPERLGDLGRARRRVLVSTGLSRFVAVFVGTIAVVCILDALVHLPGVLRAFGLAFALVAAGAFWLRGVRRSAKEPTHPLAVAMLLEDRFPKLNDSLASAVDFLEAEEAGVTNRFRRVAVKRAMNLSERCDIDSIVPTGRMLKSLALGFAVLAGAALLGLADRGRTSMALTRLADPFGNHPWPTKTTVTVLNPSEFPARVAKGEPLTLRFAISGEIPEKAVIVIRPSNGSPVNELLPINLVEGKPNEGTAEFQLDGGRTNQNFEFRILANDYVSEMLSVTVAPPPRLVLLDGRASPQVRLDFPTYTDLPTVQLPDGAGVVDAVAGTTIHFRAAADRRIASASFRFQGDRNPIRTATAAAPLAGQNPFETIASLMLSQAFTADIPVRVSGADGTLLEADFIPLVPGLYAITFTDDTGLTGTRLFDLRLFPDPTPAVVLERPASGRDPLTLLPSSALLVKAHAEDRLFGARNLFLEYRVGGPDAPLRELNLADLETAGLGIQALVGGVAPRRTKPTSLDGSKAIPVKTFLKANGDPPGDGDVITLRAASFDWDDRTALKEPGRSKEVEIRVLSKSSLEAQFQKELASLRPELLRLREAERAAREKADDVAKAAASGKPTVDDPAKLAQAEQQQRQIRNKVTDPVDGLRAKAEQLRQAMRANELPKSPTTEKIEAVADELGRIADQPLEAAEPLLNAARQEAETPGPNGAPKPDPKKLNDLLTKATKQQKAAEDGFDNLLQRLEQWGDAGEIRGEARNLKDQLNRAGDQSDKAAAKVPDGKEPGKLTPNEAAELNAPADKLEAIADQAGAVVTKAARLAAEKDAQAKKLREGAAAKEQAAAALKAEAAKEPAGSPSADQKGAEAEALKAEAEAMNRAAERAAGEAEALRNSVRQAGGQSLPDDLRKAADSLRKNQPQSSAEARKSAGERLNQLADGLQEKPPEGADELKKKQKTAADEIDKLAEAQDELRKKAKEANAIADPAKRAEELQKLAREQEKLQKQAEQLVEKLTRDRQDKQAESVRRAAEQMEAAREELERGRAATEKQDEALDRLDEALDKLDKEKQETKEQLSKEKKDQLAEQLKGLRERQKAAIDEASRIQAAVEKGKAWDRPLIASLGDLEDREKAIAAELRTFTEKNLAELPVFSKLAEQSADAMVRAARYIAERKDDVLNLDPTAAFDTQSEKATSDRVLRPMQTALRRLDQILDALDEKKDAKPPMGGMPPPPGDMPPMPPGGEQPPPPGGIPPLAQLKSLRALQAEVNERTAAFAKEHPDPEKLTDDDKDELKELEQAQRDVAELFEKLAPLFRPAPAAAPEVP